MKPLANSDVRHIVFDIGGVLLLWDPEAAFKQQIPQRQERQWFLDNVCNSAWNLEQDRGRDWTLAENLLIEQFPEQTENIRTYRRNWMQMLTGVVQETVELMSELIGKGHDVTMLTNWNQHTFAESRQKFDFLSWPRGVTVSGEVGLVKPDPAIYRLHQDTFGLAAGRTLFIDDSQSNVDAARNFGWTAERFQTPEKLYDDLRRYQLL